MVRFKRFRFSVKSVVLEQGQQVVVVVAGQVRRPEVGQQLVGVGQLRKQLQKQAVCIDWRPRPLEAPGGP